MSPGAAEETWALAVLRRALLFTSPPPAPLRLLLLLTLTFSAPRASPFITRRF